MAHWFRNIIKNFSSGGASSVRRLIAVVRSTPSRLGPIYSRKVLCKNFAALCLGHATVTAALLPLMSLQSSVSTWWWPHNSIQQSSDIGSLLLSVSFAVASLFTLLSPTIIHLLGCNWTLVCGKWITTIYLVKSDNYVTHSQIFFYDFNFFCHRLCMRQCILCCSLISNHSMSHSGLCTPWNLFGTYSMCQSFLFSNVSKQINLRNDWRGRNLRTNKRRSQRKYNSKAIARFTGKNKFKVHEIPFFTTAYSLRLAKY